MSLNTDTDYSELTNAELDRLIAEKVLGWQADMTKTYWLKSTGRVAAQISWSPTTKAEHAARLSRRLLDLNFLVGTNASSDGHITSVFLRKSGTTVETKRVDDPNGFRCVCIAALKAYEKEAAE
jgi:hypothetical protein